VLLSFDQCGACCRETCYQKQGFTPLGLGTWVPNTIENQGPKN
jgi:hypothetical protein